MKISEMIEMLQKKQKKLGDVVVKIPDPFEYGVNAHSDVGVVTEICEEDGTDYILIAD